MGEGRASLPNMRRSLTCVTYCPRDATRTTCHRDETRSPAQHVLNVRVGRNERHRCLISWPHNNTTVYGSAGTSLFDSHSLPLSRSSSHLQFCHRQSVDNGRPHVATSVFRVRHIRPTPYTAVNVEEFRKDADPGVHLQAPSSLC